MTIGVVSHNRRRSDHYVAIPLRGVQTYVVPILLLCSAAGAQRSAAAEAQRALRCAHSAAQRAELQPQPLSFLPSRGENLVLARGMRCIVRYLDRRYHK